MTHDDLVIPPTSPFDGLAKQHPDPEGAARVHQLLEECARLSALHLLTTRAGDPDDLHYRHAYGQTLTRAEFAHIKITQGPDIRSRMIPADLKALVIERSRAIVAATRAAQGAHQ